MRRIIVLLIMLLGINGLKAEDGYRLWLRYTKASSPQLTTYRTIITGILPAGASTTMVAATTELFNGFSGILDKNIPLRINVENGTLLLGNIANIAKWVSTKIDVPNNPEGFTLKTIKENDKTFTVITSKSDIGVMYGCFQLLRLMQTGKKIQQLDTSAAPTLQLRLLNHWDNLNRSVERGYAGISIFNWHTLPDYKDKRYLDYARANASIGINGVTVTNVNANALVLSRPYLEKLAALANIFRPYGIKIYLTARFSAPMELDKLKTADPLDPEVQLWWKKKTAEIYYLIPDFGGFLVKANSEGQPGPQNYQRTHADGANMLADAVAPRGGKVIWRAFVYSQDADDRFKQAYNEFLPLDGKFKENVLVQVKNGPIDFQPREPFSPLFGAMKKTPLMMEFQLTQEYLGQSTHLVYEAPLFKEVLQTDTYQDGKGSTIAKIIEGETYHNTISGMSGVSNIGNDINWTGHLFGQANWYAYGRLAWDLSLTSESIADEWIRQTFTNEKATIHTIKRIMMTSHETIVNYMTPMGLGHIMGNGNHYGPAPWSNTLPRADWNPVYYHQADSIGIGFNRTPSGSNALSQYSTEVSQAFSNPDSCDERFILWFHHVPWNKQMKSGKTLWEELCIHYYKGVNDIKMIRAQWLSLENKIDPQRFEHVSMLLNIQVKEAIWWRNACLLYFQTFSKMPIPSKFEQPDQHLDYYKSLRFPFAPGNG
jgi:alpha-glucuronidase